ncbi:MAG: folP [Burkholderiales bacterium]|jgi:dihydropteroate synthase|nr:folP [Burkholderiales bacterium]MCE3268329.1 folP [Burkholderiales bacterium]
MNYLIKFANKRDLRLLLRHNYKQKIDMSSLYKIANFYYILLQANSTIHFPETVQLISQLDTSKNDKSLQYINYTPKTAAEEYLHVWAQSEIEQTTRYILCEQNSVLSGNTRMHNHFGIAVYRCFESLVDIFAILNYTPDSFSDGGQFNQIDSALKQARHLLSMGANIIDLGAQSTRPMAKILDAQGEIKRLKEVLPYILELKKELNFELSIDTYHKETILWLANYDIDIINDVSGSLLEDVIKIILNSNKRYVAMHSLCIPANPKIVLDITTNPVDYLHFWFTNKIEILNKAGCNTANLILDPGIGFGLNAVQSWFVIKNIAKLRDIPCEILVGHSRKSFFNHISLETASNRDLETALVATNILPYVDYIRLHNLDIFNQINPVFGQTA